LFHQGWCDEIIPAVLETISCFGADIRKQQVVIKRVRKWRIRPAAESGDSQMKTLSFMLALAFGLACPALAGSSDIGPKGIGTFSYNGSPIAVSSPQAILVADR
jgi:hypothetical protein